jgi:hypothetical protein
MGMFEVLLALIALVYMGLIGIFYIYSRKSYYDRLNPLAILCCFSALNSISLFWFAINPELMQTLIFEQIKVADYRTDTVVLLAYIFSIVEFLFIASTLFLIIPRWHEPEQLLKNHELPHVFLYGKFLWAAGLLMVMLRIYLVGGPVELWTNYIFKGQEIDQSDYLQLFSDGLIILGASIIYVKLFTSKSYFSLIMLIVLSTLFLAAFGNRSPILSLLLMIVFTHNYKIKKIRSFLTFKSFLIVGTFLVVATLLVNFRVGSDTYLITNESSIKERISRDVLMRIGTLERKMVVIGHFDLSNIWYGKSYLSLIMAFLPRKLISGKPPVDTGVYIKEIADGKNPEVNSSAEMLSKTSWPDGNLAGWMNFHVIGFMFFLIFTGLLYGLYYKKMLKFSSSYTAIFFYVGLCYWGAPNFSPYGIVRILSAILFILIVNKSFRLFFSGRGRL